METIRSSEVAKLIAAAGRAAGTMIAKCREAAQAAEPQLNPELPFGERVDAVTALYADDFKAVDHNVRALFKDFLTILAGKDTPVTLEVAGKDGKEEKHFFAAECIGMAKHPMKDAAKQVRDAHGIGRAAGAGRKPRTPDTKAPTAAPAEKLITAGDKAAVGTNDPAFGVWLDNIAAYMADPVHAKRVVAAFKDAGYTVAKAKNKA